MTQKGSRRGKAASKGGAKSRGGKQKTTKKQKKVSQSKKISKNRKKSGSTRMKRTYKNTEEKRNEIIFKMLKDYKVKDTVGLEEILMSFSEDDMQEFNDEGVDYQDMAEQLLEHYRNKTFDLSQFVFTSDIFEDLLKKTRMNC